MSRNAKTFSSSYTFLEGMSPLITNGTAPIADMISQLKATMINPSRAKITLFFVFG